MHAEGARCTRLVCPFVDGVAPKFVQGNTPPQHASSGQQVETAVRPLLIASSRHSVLKVV